MRTTARNTPQVIVADTIGRAWLSVADRILTDGAPSTYDGLPIVELSHVMLDIATPNPDDTFIAEHGDPERLAWMRANFRRLCPCGRAWRRR